MEELYKIIKLILNGVEKPWMAVVGVIASIFGYAFWGAIKAKLRKMKAETEKQKDKNKDIDSLEDSNAEADNSATDVLRNREI
jgi:hypothetical protein